jgi:hypothetical protein
MSSDYWNQDVKLSARHVVFMVIGGILLFKIIQNLNDMETLGGLLVTTIIPVVVGMLLVNYLFSKKDSKKLESVKP